MKIKTIKNRFIIPVMGILMFSQLNIKAQTDTQSPYSFYGLGALTENALQNGSAMGGIYNGLRDSIAINYLNPASYTAIDVTQLNFSFETNILQYTANGTQQTNQSLFINHVGLGIPIMHRKFFGMGLYLGFSPYSQIRYNFSDTSDVIYGTDSLVQKNVYNGSGGLNKLTFGTGFRIGKHISFGGNVHYVFGVSDRNRSLILPIDADYLSSRVQEKTTVNTVFADFGIQYASTFKIIRRIRPNDTTQAIQKDKSKWPVKEKHYHFTVGGTYILGRSFEADFDQLGIQYISGNIETGLDTFFINPSSRGNITTPHGFGAGFTLSNPDIWTVGADFNYGLWSQFNYFDQPALQYSDSWNVSAGVEFMPPYTNRYNGKFQFFKNIIYRAGFRYFNKPLRPDGNPVDQVGISFGLGLPFGAKKFYNENLDIKTIMSYINLGFEGGFAQSRNGGIIDETFFRFTMGIALRDKWFTKRKFN